MTERTVRSMAKELAGIFYEDSKRNPAFRQAFPTLKDYMRGLWHQQNGEIKIDKPGWTYHIELARKVLASMLGKPDTVVSPLMKERIFEALLEENQKSKNGHSLKIPQRKETDPIH